MLGVFIIPTGINCAIGGHAGDATCAARLVAAACDTLIVHPNVVNAADMMEASPNMLYVDGAMLDRFMAGNIYLQLVSSNRILIVCNELSAVLENCANVARSLLGAVVEIVVLDDPLTMISEVKDGCAGGTVAGVDALVNQIAALDYDALAVYTEVEVDDDVALKYLREGGVNPWGGVEAMASRMISERITAPIAHAPSETRGDFNEIVSPALSPELISHSNLYSVLKGLHKAPRIGTDRNHLAALSIEDVDVLITPDCYSTPHIEAKLRSIPIIQVMGNTTNSPTRARGNIEVANYLEAAGAVLAIREGMRVSGDLFGLTSTIQ